MEMCFRLGSGGNSICLEVAYCAIPFSQKNAKYGVWKWSVVI